jgi:putative heme-binding domain-containing protein
MSWEQMAYVQIDWVGSFTAAAGCVVYDGGTWPAEYKGDYFTTEPTINVVHHTRLTPKGSSYLANKLPGREATEFIRSKDMWWRPIEVRVGPDGAIYIADFYNQAVIHNDTRGPDHNRVNAAVRPDRDHYFGRIWRLDHKQAKKVEVPNLAAAGPDELMTQLANPNRAVRMNASRLLVEAAQKADEQTRTNMQLNGLQRLRQEWDKLDADAKIAAMWTLRNSGYVGKELGTPLRDADPSVRRNAALLVEEYLQTVAAKPGQTAEVSLPASDLIQGLLNDPDGQVRLAALRALAAGPLSDAAARELVAAWPKFEDDFQRSAAIGAGSRNPAAVIGAALDRGDASLNVLVGQLAQGVAEKNDAAAAGKLVIAMAEKPSAGDSLKRTVLDTLAKSLKATPEMSPGLTAALGKLLGSAASEAVLPLAAKWDKAGALKETVTKLTGNLALTLNNEKSDAAARLAAAQRLIGLRSAVDDALATVTKQLTREGAVGLKRDIIIALSDTADPSVGQAITAAFPQLPPEAQGAAFDAILKRSEWVFAFLDAAKSKQIDVSGLGPANLNRLRTHPDAAVSKRATELLDELNPLAKMKNETIAKLSAIVEQPGNAAKGKELFTTACAICHNFGGAGADVGPGLTGMGSHGPSELLTAIVDPNREVDPSFVQWNIETKDGQSFAGIIARENPATVLLKSLAGQQEVKAADIKSRVNTGRSLMPEGLEGLGGEALRDIIAYMQSVDGGRFRTLDLRSAFTASTSQGLYNSQAIKRESLVFLKTGTVNVGGIPFEIVAPEKGGQWSQHRRVERRTAELLFSDHASARGYSSRRIQGEPAARSRRSNRMGIPAGWRHE